MIVDFSKPHGCTSTTVNTIFLIAQATPILFAMLSVIIRTDLLHTVVEF